MYIRSNTLNLYQKQYIFHVLKNLLHILTVLELYALD